MNFTRHFTLVDDVTAHFDGVLIGMGQEFTSRYTGFYAVTSAAILELALKDIVVSFAQKNHMLFGEYVSAKYERINGKISFDDCIKEHLKPFGKKYQEAFKLRAKKFESYCLLKHGRPMKQTYENLLTCRHSFAHEGNIPSSTTYGEMKQGFEAGKLVMTCLARTLNAR
ncbi:MAG: HEPN domain-containing protein [Stenotrophomonas sp.]|uniref:HEPN domain-containing protein n=1 Tax=Stenotrophomonas sp. TaxID=69392 RepID=UPI0033147EAF